MKRQYFFLIFYAHWRMHQNFFVQKKYKTRRVTHGRMVYMISQKPVVWHKNKKIFSLSILYWLSLNAAFYFFFIFGDEKKIPEFFTTIFVPKLHVIIINNYWKKHNIDKIVRQPKDTSPENKCTKFQVDSLIRSRDIVYTVWKKIF